MGVEFVVPFTILPVIWVGLFSVETSEFVDNMVGVRVVVVAARVVVVAARVVVVAALVVVVDCWVVVVGCWVVVVAAWVVVVAAWVVVGVQDIVIDGISVGKAVLNKEKVVVLFTYDVPGLAPTRIPL